MQEEVKQPRPEKLMQEEQEQRPGKVTTHEFSSVGFLGDKVYPLGAVTFPVTAGTSPKQVTFMVDFIVVDCPSAYNIILGRIALNSIRAITSTYHLLIRFPTVHGVGELRGDQATARECYLTSLREKMSQETMIIEELEDVFTWTHEDMPGISPAIIQHHLNVHPSFKPIRQKRRTFTSEENQAIPEEVEKLLRAHFIQKVHYPDWLSNVVLVKKANGK
ncbi:uncharacterized protein LOC132281055 [Cornus florida]|uniref:uncharacterized protein LOC132281055 n=1 Tax=Cornus florida TaxID=4283 RepID=UPI00289DE579|nr:uncharacterized protein LOC132281055 [Cornus florida]